MSEYDALLDAPPLSKASEYDALLDPTPQRTEAAPSEYDALLTDEGAQAPVSPAINADQPGLGDDFRNVWNSIKRGVMSLKQSMDATVVNSIAEEMDRLEKMKNQKEGPNLFQSAPDPERIAKLQQMNQETAVDAVKGIAEAEKSKQAIPPTGPVAEFQSGEHWVKALVNNPVEVVSSLVAESLPQMAPALAAAAINPVAGASVTVQNSYANEYASSILDSFRQNGADLTNPDSIEKLFADPERLKAAREYAQARAVPVSVFDALSAGMAGKFVKAAAGKGLGRMVGAALGEVGVQATAGAAGEAGAQLASTGEISEPRAVVAEAIAEIASAPAEVFGAVRDSKAKAAVDSDISSTLSQTPERTAATTKQTPDVPLSPESDSAGSQTAGTGEPPSKAAGGSADAPEIEPASLGGPRPSPVQSEPVGGPGAMSPQEAAEMSAAASERTTSTKNAVMEAERTARNADPVIKEARQSNQATLDAAEAKIEANPNHAQSIVRGLIDGTKREVSEVDEGVLLYEKVRLRNAREMEAQRASDENSTPEERLVAKQKWEELESQINDIDTATAASGRIWGKLGQFRQRLLREDFTFEAMERRARIEKGESLTPEESEKIKQQATKIADLEKELDKLRGNRDTEAATKAVDEAVSSIRKKTGGTKSRVVNQSTILESLKTRLANGEAITDLRSYIQRLAESFVRGGITERDPLINAVHGALQPIVPNLSRRDTMDLISGYGEFKPLDNDPVKTQLRDLKGQMQQVGKIEDMQAKQAPAKTGIQRRTPSDEERRLIKEVNELKKKGGFSVTDPASQLKSALDAIKTRLKNQIKDITTQIDTGERPTVREGVAYDDEANRLKELRDRVRQTLEDIEGKPEMSDEQRIKIASNALDKAIAETERQIKTGDLYPERIVKKTPTSTELDAKRAKLDALRAERDLLRALDTTTNENNRENALLDSIAELQRKIAAGDTSTKSKPATVDTEAVATLKAEQKALQKQLNEMRRGPKATPEEIALKAFKTRTANRIAELHDRMARGDFEAKAKREVKLDPEATKLKFQIEKTKEEYNKALLADRLSKRSVPRKIVAGAAETINTLRAIMTSFDVSAVFRQSGFITLGNPVRALKAFPAMFKALASEKAQFAVMEEIKSRPNYLKYKASKLYLAEQGGSLSQLEEAYMSRWAEKIPGVGASQRAYITFLNKMRADTFDAMEASLAKSGSATPDEAKAIANFINVATGRGSLGGLGAGPVLNTVFFSPRYLASRFQLIAGQPLYGGTARTRGLVAKEYAKFLIGVAAVYGLAKLAGADDVEDDPRSSEFGKIKFGNTRLDPLSGLLQATVLLSRLGTGETKTASGKINPIHFQKKEFGKTDVYDVTTDFLRSKLSPQIGAFFNVRSGTDMIGQPATLKSEAAKMVVPLSFGDIKKAMEEQGVPKGAALGLLSLFGMGLQTYDRDKKD